ncbi:MAG: transglycosylase domain-containing protein [Roseburia sp.]|nr:transglycosylase domain-containing protein [Roseburia sp.]MCM1098444.1 transglycosylase domain-containing protein [Ruminococcus flavefaciens]
MNYGKKGVRAKQKALNSKTVKIERKLLLGIVKLFLIALVGIGICGVSAGLGAYKGILASTPNIRFGDVVASGQATIVYDCEGNEIDQYVSSNSNRLRIESMDELPDYLGKAFVAIEDKRFYQNNGIDFMGMLRAGYTFLRTRGKRAEGASTITQQLLKNTIFTEWTSEGENFIKKIKRKLQEQYLAVEISKYYDKDLILLEYMNAINLGQNTLGVEAASKRYFGKSASDLTISESAVIASITQNPSRLNPISHPDNNAERRKRCLDTMLELEFITDAEYQEALADSDAVYERIGNYDIDYRENTNTSSGSYFSDAVYEQVLEDLVTVAGYDQAMAEKILTSGGLRIESTMDPTIQKIMDEEYANPDNFPENVKWLLSYALTITAPDGTKSNFSKENMTSWYKKNKSSNFNLLFSSHEDAYEAIATYRAAMMEELGVVETEDNYEESVSLTPQPQSAAVLCDQRTGYVRAMVGGRGVKEGRRTWNRATYTQRSPGSTFKVLAAFAPALDSAGQTLATVYNDAPFNYDDGTPIRNWYDTGYKGISSIRDAIRTSMNIIAVKTETVIGPQLGYDYCLNFGFTTLTDGEIIDGKLHTDVLQPLALGGITHGVTPYEMNAAYASIANLGTYVVPKLYTRVLDSEGNILLDNTSPTRRQVLKETTAFLLTDAMVDVITAPGGTASIVNFDHNMPMAGKTGSSTGYKDSWFAGFTPYYTCTVWTGYDNNIDMKTTAEKNTSRNIWRSVMQRVHENLSPEPFPVPQGLVQAAVCSKSGKLPIPGLCPDECIINEYFEDGTVPTESCDIHYEGEVCEYDGLPASPECPFKIPGRLELPLIEDPALIAGSTMITQNPDGTSSVVPPVTSNHCQHDINFYLNPDYEAIQNGQQWEIMLRRQAAAEAAAADAAQAAQGQ